MLQNSLSLLQMPSLVQRQYAERVEQAVCDDSSDGRRDDDPVQFPVPAGLDHPPEFLLMIIKILNDCPVDRTLRGLKPFRSGEFLR